MTDRATPTLVKGDKFTIAGVGLSSKGKLVIDGCLAGTRRKCKAVKPVTYTVTVHVEQMQGAA